MGIAGANLKPGELSIPLCVSMDLLEYFGCRYITGTYKKVECIKLYRIKALYLPEIWNVHESTLNGEHRTNNICERWNNRFIQVKGHNYINFLHSYNMESS